jgi:aminopeptidase
MAFDPQLTPGARNAVRVCLRVLPSEKVTVITDEVSLEIAAAIVHELEEMGCRYQTWVLEDVATRPVTDLPLADREGSGDEPGQHFCRAGADQRTEVAHADDGRREPAKDPARAHGQHQQADHAGRHARGLPEGRPAQREGAGDGAPGEADSGEDAFGNGPGGGFESELPLGEDERDYQHGEMGQPAGRRSFTTPGEVNGTFVIDGVVGDYLCAKFGDLKAHPLTIEVKGNR